MYLKGMKLQGFKSFADKTEIEFEKDITAIVGPNGSGKSNISDAIRWVLGEQSAKNLRGSKMEDIIFSGTNERRALGYAEVSMYFDNKEGYIPVDYSEVVITRRMFRSGESEFYINKNLCRLKDIHEIFMDTGIGKDGYSIIGQGKIDEILSDRPEDRRNIFEEAAGIVKYKNKKNNTEKKLLDTEDNLIRIKDLLSEISKQEEKLAVESIKAKKFTVLYEKLKNLEINLFLKDINRLNKEINKLEIEIELDLHDIKAKEDHKVKTEERARVLRSDIEKNKILIEDLVDKQSKLIFNIENNKNKINILEEKEKYHHKDKERIISEIEGLNELNNTLNIENKKLYSEEKSLLEYNENILKVFQTKERELLSIKSDIEKKEQNLDLEKEKIMTIHSNISNIDGQLNSVKSLRESVSKRINNLEENISISKQNINNFSHTIKDLELKEIKLKDSLKELQSKQSKYTFTEERYKENLDDINESLKGKEIKLQGIISNYKLYQNMEKYHEGYYSSVKNLLNGIKKSKLSSKGYIGLVLDLLKVDKKYERAIDISLGSSLQNIVIEKEDNAKIMIDYLKKNNEGRVTFLPLEVIKGNPLNINIDKLKKLGVLGLGHELIKYDEKYEKLFQYLLGRTIVVNNIDNGIRLANKFNHRYRIVTLDGEVLNPGGSLTGGSYNNNFNLISRKNKVEDLRNKIGVYEEDISNLKEKKNIILEEFKHNNEMKTSINSKIKDEELNIIQLSNSKGNIIQEKDREEKEIKGLSNEIKKLKEEFSGSKEKEKEYSNEKNKLNEDYNLINSKIKIINEDLLKVKNNEDDMDGELINYKIRLNNLKNKLENLANKIGSNNDEKVNNIKLLEIKSNTLDSIEKDIKSIIQNRKDILSRIKEGEEESSILTIKINEEKTTNNKLIKELNELEEDLKETNTTLILMEKNKNKKDLTISKFKLKHENKNNKLFEDYDLDYESALSLQDESIDLNKSKERITNLKTTINKLGNINLASLEDHKLIKERLDFLETQYVDLINSKENLSRLIKDIERQMRKEFNNSFKKINENFTKIFSILFDGGIGTLELEEEKDVLESGIQIKAQPPGKRLQNISLLSGGEKSLTAVALLFAILELRPAPFCILDEIDASLDDANIIRYTNYLNKINKHTQFILITHQKLTMEIANVLYGVTMVEKGVSRLISVRLEDYVKDLVI